MNNIKTLLLGFGLSCTSLLQASTIEPQELSAVPLLSTYPMEVTIDLEPDLEGKGVVCVQASDNTFFLYTGSGRHTGLEFAPTPGRYIARGDFILDDKKEFPDNAVFRFITPKKGEPGAGKMLGKGWSYNDEAATADSFGLFSSSTLTAPGPNPYGLNMSLVTKRSGLNSGKCPNFFNSDTPDSTR